MGSGGVDYSKEYFTIESLADNNSISFGLNSNSANITISWSLDKETWHDYTAEYKSPWTYVFTTLSSGEKVYIKGNNFYYSTSTSLSYHYFRASEDAVISGNIMSLIYGDNFQGETTISYQYAFNNLFYNFSHLTNAENLILPATSLSSYCYSYMFNGCSALTKAPVLPAETMASYCYYFMFYGCSALTTAPDLPAETMASYCYYSMFYGCSALTTAPDLPAETMATYCYGYMFINCRSLTTLPELPAETLAEACYFSMFNGCTLLATAIDLPATTLAESCYNGMFSGCTLLTTAPELPATRLEKTCYRNMFYGCSRIDYIKCLANTNFSASNCLQNWLSSVSATGTFVKSRGVSWPSGVSGIPSGWTVQEI